MQHCVKKRVIKNTFDMSLENRRVGMFKYEMLIITYVYYL